MSEDNRRPVESRDKKVFHRLAHALVAKGLTPNQISVTSAFFGLLAGLAFFAMSRAPDVPATAGLALVALIGIQGRLICNLIDGLMAVEGGLKTKTGELFNEIPDRVSDTFVLVGAGFAVAVPEIQWLGFIAALFAMATAYVRVLGAAQGAGHFFAGPFAKQHRMFLMNLCAIACPVERALGSWGWSVGLALSLIAIGSFATCLKRLRLISAALNAK